MAAHYEDSILYGPHRKGGTLHGKVLSWALHWWGPLTLSKTNLVLTSSVQSEDLINSAGTEDGRDYSAPEDWSRL